MGNRLAAQATPTQLIPSDRIEVDGSFYEVIGTWRPPGSDYVCVSTHLVGATGSGPVQFTFDRDTTVTVVDLAPF